MQIIKGVSEFKCPLNKTVVTIGNFDGVHIGHRALLNKTLELSEKYQAHSVVMSFHPHPIKVLFPEREFTRLFEETDQEGILRDMGLEYFVQQPFSRELSGFSAERFLNEIVLKPMNPCAMVVGYDFAFGANREGSLEYLENFCKKMNIELAIIPPVRERGEIVSSSLLRSIVQDGQIEFASKLLGRPFYIKGIVEKGHGRGKKIGFPTANVFTQAECYPKKGVYLCRTLIRGKVFKSLTNVGNNPTFQDQTRHPIMVENHILDFDDDIYGESIKVEFLEYLREEKKFSGVEELVAQITKDVSTARSISIEMGGDSSKSK